MTAVETYLESHDGILNEILAELYHPEEPPVYPAVILNRYTAVFCILLELGKGKHIEHFVRHDNLRDTCLPFTLSKTARDLDFPDDPKDAPFFQKFYEAQWKFSAPVFNYPMHEEFDENVILPITAKEQIHTSKALSVTLYKIQLHHNYNQLEPRDEKKVRE